MIKRKIDKYLQDFFSQNKKALLLTGARQIGKTFSIRHFGQENYESFVELNFIDHPELVQTFGVAMNSRDILLRLSTVTKQQLIPGKNSHFL